MENWKVKMERWLTDGVTPDITVLSSFTYELPRDWSEMLNSFDRIDDPYKDAVLAGVAQHLQKQFAKDGFFPGKLIPPMTESEQ